MDCQRINEMLKQKNERSNDDQEPEGGDVFDQMSKPKVDASFWSPIHRATFDLNALTVGFDERAREPYRILGVSESSLKYD